MPSWCGTGDTPEPPDVGKYLRTKGLCLLQRLGCGGRNQAVNGLAPGSVTSLEGAESAGRVASVAHDGDGGWRT